MDNNIRSADGKIRLQVIVECDWQDEEYDSVLPEIILEDALTHFSAKDGVKVYLDPKAYDNKE